MSRYNQKKTSGAPSTSHVLWSDVKARLSTPTLGGAPGYARDTKAELFIRATGSFAGQKSFYETADKRDTKLVELTEKLAVNADGWEWLCGFVPWLRGEGNMRTSSLIIAAEAVRARLDRNLPSPLISVGLEKDLGNPLSHRQLLDSVMQRADEPGELLAYWHSVHGRKLPQPVKRAIADAATRLYTERNLLKYDTASHGVRFGDVLELTHAKPRIDAPWQGDLFKHAIDRRHGNDSEIPDLLRTIRANRIIRQHVAVGVPDVLLDAETLRSGGMTWEDALSLAGSSVPKDKLWEAMIPSMGYMALIRNLRNFDEAGISNSVARTVADRIADPEQVAKSRQLPFRFLSAYLNAPSLRWAQALEEAISHSLNNVPTLDGHTLVLIDTSGSMTNPMSENSKVKAVMAAALFGLALKMKNPENTDVYGWADGHFSVNPDKGFALLKLAQEFQKLVGSVGHGTRMASAVQTTYKGQDRVLLLSDMQAFPADKGRGAYGVGDVNAAAPATTPVYCWNIVGYSNSAMPSNGKANRYDLSGLTDHAFKMIGQLEGAQRSMWPWSKSDQV